MKCKIYTEKEIEKLKKNPFVIEVERHRFIKYDALFKLWCVIQRILYPEKTCREIFASAGFDISIMSPKLPQSRIKDWENVFYRFGYGYFISKKCYAKLKEELIKIEDDSKNEKLRKKIYKDVVDYLRGLQ